MQAPTKIYLAGPGVFRPDCKQWGERLKAACVTHGLEGLYPLDGEIPSNLTNKAEQRYWIFANNCALIRKADVIFADLRAFRSASEPDSGTAFEVGFAHALGKPIWLWLPDCEPGIAMRERIKCRQTPVGWLDDANMAVEDFSAPLNLMLWDAASGISYHNEPEAALSEMASQLVSSCN